jgi:hypothetical protein
VSLRGDLLAAAVAQRDKVFASLAPDLAHVARYEWGRVIDRLASGEPYRLTREELPRGHAERTRGKFTDVLTLDSDGLLRTA